jgi:hypothetical protein
MRRLYRVAAAIVPPPHRAWIEAHQAELDHIERGWQRRRWALGLVPLTGIALVAQLRSDARSFRGGTLMKTVVTTLSVLNIAAGIGLTVLAVAMEGTPPIVIALSAVLLIQGGYTLAYVGGLLGSGFAQVLELAGSTLALVVGGVASVGAAIANIDPVGGDPEYAPMAVAMLIAAHGLASLIAFAGRRGVGVGTR